MRPNPPVDERMDVEPQINWHESPVVEPSYVLSKEEVNRFLGPQAPLTTQNKSSGIAKYFARYRYHPSHPLLSSHPLPYSKVTPPILSLSMKPPPSLRHYLLRQSPNGPRTLLTPKMSGLTRRLSLLLLPPIPLLGSAGSVDAPAISSWDVQSRALDRERTLQRVAFYATMTSIGSNLVDFAFKWIASPKSTGITSRQ